MQDSGAKVDLKKRREKAMCRFYNYFGHDIDSVEDIPYKIYLFLDSYTLKELSKPFIIMDMLMKKSQGKITIETGLNRAAIRDVGAEKGLCTK